LSDFKGVSGSKEWEGRGGIFMEGRGGEGELCVWFKRVKGRGGILTIDMFGSRGEGRGGILKQNLPFYSYKHQIVS
jgi:hypothetical protein